MLSEIYFFPESWPLMKLSNLFNGNKLNQILRRLPEVDILLCVLVIRCLLLLFYLYLYVKHQTSSKYAVNEKVHREVKVNDINMSQYSLLTLCCLQGGKFGWRIGLFNRIANKRQKIQYVSEKKKMFLNRLPNVTLSNCVIHIAIYISIFFLQEIQ